MAASLLAWFTGCTSQAAPHDGLATITHVVDGDTVDITIDGRDERVRLIGIDTPETKKPNWPVECYGPEASEFTTELLPVGTRVRIERDVVGRDDYGRLLGYVYITGEPGADGADGDDHDADADSGGDGGDSGDSGETFVNDELVRRGYARPLTIAPNDAHAAQFSAAATAAERADLGLWAACS